MHFRSRLSRLAAAFVILMAMATLAFGDTIRLKDGSIIKGKIISFGGGNFTVVIGDGSRQRQMTFTSEEVESIQFDNPAQATTSTTPVNTPAADKYSIPQKVITVGQTAKPAQTVPEQTQPTVSEPKPSSNAAGKAIGVDVKVLADNTANGWTNTGWVVKKGQRIRIVGDGRVSLGNGRYATASGISSLSDNEKLLKNVATGALIAVIGDDNNEFIFIGEEKEFVAERDGALFLGVNEGNLEDNSGAFDVKVEIVLDGE